MNNMIRRSLLIFGYLLIPYLLLAQDSVHVNLQQAIEIALNDNPTIKIANRNIESKKYSKDEQIAALFPTVSGSGSYQRTVKKQKMTMEMGGNPMTIEVGTSNNYSAGLSLSLPLVAAPTWYNLKLSQLDVEAAMESARSSRISLVNEVKKAYYGMLLAKDSYQVLLVNYENVEYTAQNINAKYEQGLASDFDKLRADVQVKNQKPQLTAAENTVQLATMMLKVLIGVDVNEPIIFDGQLSDFENEMLSYQVPEAQNVSLSNNSDLQQLDLSKNSLDMSVKLIKASACPTLVFSGSAQYMTMSNDFKFADYKPFDPKPVSGISTKYDEYLATISPDGEYFYFTRRQPYTQQTAFGNETSDREFFSYSKQTGNGSYETGKPLPSPFNESSGEGSPTINLANDMLIFAAVHEVRGKDEQGKEFTYPNYDLFFSKWNGLEWSEPRSLGDKVNRENSWESQPTLSSDGNILFFASDRPGGYGGSDIWMSERDANGNWQEPVNLGPIINTKGNERSPFLHTDSRTLYFSGTSR